MILLYLFNTGSYTKQQESQDDDKNDTIYLADLSPALIFNDDRKIWPYLVGRNPKDAMLAPRKSIAWNLSDFIYNTRSKQWTRLSNKELMVESTTPITISMQTWICFSSWHSFRSLGLDVRTSITTTNNCNFQSTNSNQMHEGIQTTFRHSVKIGCQHSEIRNSSCTFCKVLSCLVFLLISRTCSNMQSWLRLMCSKEFERTVVLRIHRAAVAHFSRLSLWRLQGNGSTSVSSLSSPIIPCCSKFAPGSHDFELIR